MLSETRYGADFMDNDRSETPVLLARIAAEIADCADMTSALQEEICPDRAEVSAREIVSMQKLDLIDQTLRALAGILSSVANEVGDARLDLSRVLRDCTLSALASRLGGEDAPPPDEDFELF